MNLNLNKKLEKSVTIQNYFKKKSDARILKYESNLFYKNILFLGILFVSSLSESKDFSASINAGKSELTTIARTLGPVSLIIAGLGFYFSSRIGTGILISALIAIALFSSADSLFLLINRIFS